MPSFPKPNNVVRVAVTAKDWVVKNPKTAALTVVAPVAAAVATPLALSAVGFSTGGVTGASTAAAVHASYGSPAAGSLFSLLQSAGAGGSALPMVQGAAFGAATAITAGGTYVFNKMKGKKEAEKSEKNGKQDWPKSKL